MNTRKAYNEWASTYDDVHNPTRDLDEQVVRKTLGDRHLGSVLELGCGTGKNTALFARISKKVHALDFSEGMIQKARAKLGPSGHINFQVADLTIRWPVASASMELIVCNLVLEHIKDLTFIFSEAQRTLRAGGRFFICEFHPFKQYQGKQARFQKDRGITLIPAFTHHVSDFVKAACDNGLDLESLNEWWHSADGGKPPRLVSFMFKKPTRSKRQR